MLGQSRTWAMAYPPRDGTPSPCRRWCIHGSTYHVTFREYSFQRLTTWVFLAPFRSFHTHPPLPSHFTSPFRHTQSLPARRHDLGHTTKSRPDPTAAGASSVCSGSLLRCLGWHPRCLALLSGTVSVLYPRRSAMAAALIIVERMLSIVCGI